jgi:hemoglobin-like flavoprotein
LDSGVPCSLLHALMHQPSICHALVHASAAEIDRSRATLQGVVEVSGNHRSLSIGACRYATVCPALLLEICRYVSVYLIPRSIKHACKIIFD